MFPRLYRFYAFILVWNKNKRVLRFDPSSSVDLHSSFEGANRILSNCHFVGSMGYGSYLGQNSNVEAIIGRFTSIAPNLQINKGVHPYKAPFATTCPLFYSNADHYWKSFAERKMFTETRPLTHIGSDVWIGQNVFMTGGLDIGDGSVILTGAVVTKSTPPMP